MASDYDFGAAFARIEAELIDSMMRNLRRNHLDWEDAEGFDWSQWQVEQLRYLEEYRQRNVRRFGPRFSSINARLDEALQQAYENGQKAEELRILESLVNHRGAVRSMAGGALRGAGDAFFRVNERKLDALLNATHSDMLRAEQAVLRRANDQYRKIIFNAQMYANTGAGTVEKAVDMATKDFLMRGIDCIEYKNGARHTIQDYADMAIRTAERRAVLYGEGQKRQEWGIDLVEVVMPGGHPCPECARWRGKILVDDVYSGGRPDGKHQLLSEAMAAGFLHPRCKDSVETFFPWEEEPEPNPLTGKELAEAEAAEKREADQQNAERIAERWDRRAKYQNDPGNRRMAKAHAERWQRSAEAQPFVNRAEEIMRRARAQYGEGLAASAETSGGHLVRYEDITGRWYPDATPGSHEVRDLMEYTAPDGKVYRVHGRDVVLDYDAHEKEIAELLEREIGGEIFMVPKVNNPQGVRTPDYLFHGKAYDLKTLGEEAGPNTMYNRVKKATGQAAGIIVDITNTSLTDEIIASQINKIFRSSETQFVKEVVIVQGNGIRQVVRRK